MSIKLTVGNSTSQIEGLTGGQQRELGNLMSVRIEDWGVYYVTPYDLSRLFFKHSVLFRDAQGIPRPVYSRAGKALKSLQEARELVAKGGCTFRGHWHRSRPLIDRYGRFETGLLYIAEEYLKKGKLRHERHDARERPPLRDPLPIHLGAVVPRPEQLEAVEAAARDHRGIIVAPTGFGKSVVAALLIARFGVQALVVVPTLALKHQLTEDLRRFFGDKLFDTLIQVENVDAIDPKKPAYADLVIIDEFHHSGAMTYRKLNKHAWKSVYYKFGLTATPFRSQDHERLLLEGVLSKVIYRVTYKTAVEKGYVVPVEAYYIDLPKIDVEGVTWAEVYRELVVRRKDRNEIIRGLLVDLSGRSTLCLVKEIKHAAEIHPEFPFAHGEDGQASAMINWFNKGGLSLIGTTGVLGEGVDTRPAEYVIIAGLGKSKNAFMQQVGRAFRRFPGKESCKIILFRDQSHRWMLEHFRAQCEYLKEEYGVKPVKLKLTPP